ncbi:MAG: PEGA domain-containing protein [Firmicutes bacterium]|nr:PEGA domain-containing protein [Bacillota bacterium]
MFIRNSHIGVAVRYFAVGMLMLLGVSTFAFAKPIAAVIGINDLSGRYLPKIEDTALELVNIFLVESGQVTVVERNRLSGILEEQNYARRDFLDLDRSAVEFGRLLGAEYLITGAIISFEQNTDEFDGYGIKLTKTVSQMHVTLQAFDVNTGVIVQAVSFIGTHEENDAPTYWASRYPRTLLEKSLKGATDLLIERLCRPDVLGSDFAPNAENGVLLSAPADHGKQSDEEVTVYIKSTPPGADILVEGLFFGKTPQAISLPPGLWEVKLKYPGFSPWVREINAFHGLRVNAVLQTFVESSAN